MQCAVCSSGADDLCSGCDLVAYCSPQCQTQHWAGHRAACAIGDNNFTEGLPGGIPFFEDVMHEFLDELTADRSQDLMQVFKFFHTQGVITEQIADQLRRDWKDTTRDLLNKTYLESVLKKTAEWATRYGRDNVLFFAITTKMQKRRPTRGTPAESWRIGAFAIVFIDKDGESALLSVLGSRDFRTTQERFSLGGMIHYMMFARLQDRGVRHLYLEAANTDFSTSGGTFTDINNNLVQVYFRLLYRISATDCTNPDSDWRSKFQGLTDEPRRHEQSSRDRHNSGFFVMQTSGPNGLAMSWCDLDKGRIIQGARAATQHVVAAIDAANAGGRYDDFFVIDS